MTDTEDKQDAAPGKGKAFFDRADEVAATGNWDFAIQMYLEGVRREPGNLQRGHAPMREVSLKRKFEGGKPAGFMEAMKHKGGKEPIDALVNAEFLLAKDPGDVAHMTALLKAAQQLGQNDLTKWICDILFEATRQSKRPNKNTLVMIARSYAEIEHFGPAVAACEMAMEADPGNSDLEEMVKDFSAKYTIKQGQYDTEGSFTKSVLDMDKQIELTQHDHLVQSRDFTESEIEKTRAEYDAAPKVAGKINALVDVLLKIEEEGYENEAIDVLKKACAEGNYRFKARMDDIKIRQMRRRCGELKSSGDTEEAERLARELAAFELEVYAERAENYPTDLSIKYELGRRQFAAGRIDEAIGLLQQAQREPKRRLAALSLLGQAFAKKGWHREAVDTYEKALEYEPPEVRAKELHYNLAQALKAMGQKSKARDHFSKVAQMDFNFLDVRQQIEMLRNEDQ